MKNLTITLSLAFISLIASAQSEYEKAMGSALEQFGQAKSMDDMLQSAAKFEQIAEVESNKWLPGYYAAMIYCITTFRSQDNEQKTTFTNKAQEITDKLLKIADNESEVHTLQGMIYQAVVTIDPAKNGQIYGSKANGALQTAMKLDPSNPRPIYLQATALMYTPEQYGGGKKAAEPLFAQAMELFEKEEQKGEFYPNWGKEDCAKNLAECSK